MFNYSKCGSVQSKQNQQSTLKIFDPKLRDIIETPLRYYRGLPLYLATTSSKHHKIVTNLISTFFTDHFKMWIDEVYFPNIGSNSVLIHGLDIVPILLQYYFHEHCSNIAVVKCLWCKKSLCLKHFFEYHYCNEYNE
ncbi:hypothetical protein ALC53_13431 [Atta colombica]|uniref:Transposase Tc5 C-terminal domain-containing protein n=1 Tax=Atta colombica TaxID=520822 RepID=A0A151HXU0_9HYME|nr:hypothetical protein ALC53_13431 [Atta colombica]